MWSSLKALLNAEPRCPDVPNATRCEGTAGSGLPAKYAVTSRGTFASIDGAAVLPASGFMLADTGFLDVSAENDPPRHCRRVPRFPGGLLPWAFALGFALFSPPDSSHIRLMAKNPDNPKKPVKTPKSKAPNSKASRPDVQPIGPALAELLNPAINRGESGIGSSTGLQPPPDNSWDRRAGGEAAAHRARASTRGTSDEVAKRDASLTKAASLGSPPPNPPPQAGEGSSRLTPRADGRDFSGVSPPASPLPLAGVGQGGGASTGRGFDEAPQSEFAPANYGTAATIPALDPELARQLGFTTEEEDAAAMARPPRNKMEALGVAATADALENLIREGRPEFKGEDGQVKIWAPHRPPRPEKSEGGQPFVIKSEYEPKGDQPTAIKELVEGIRRNDRTQVLLGVTGSGKTYTM